MKPGLRHALLAAGLWPLLMAGQTVDRTKYPDYSSTLNPDPSLMRTHSVKGLKAVETRPDHVNNGESKYFPPILLQQGGSCGSASRICYMFSHELNSYRDLDGKDANNYYPSHFVWLLTNGNSGKDAFVQFVGVPSAATYGGQAYSKLFGYQEETQNDFGWMTGYDKWYSAMFNRMLKPSHFSASLGTDEGREAVKNWLWNHNGDTDFHSGGVVGIGVASGGVWKDIPKTTMNDAIGVSGKSYVSKWGTSVDHALTIVGYDDRIEFDLNGNGVYGEESADEKGAWIIANSWGDDWENEGFIYCPYAYAGASFNSSGTFSKNWWTPEVYKVRKNYRPLRTIKINMDYSRRSELYLMAGVSKNLDATEPEYTQAFEHFKYAGDGNYGNTEPAPEVPMLGRWADGKLHDEPMEFGYDLTDLSSNLDQNEPLKYFFIIETKKTAVGDGHIYNASILDYAQDNEGLEIPFFTGSESVKVENGGNRTVLSVVVPGRGVKAPQNAGIADGVLSWCAPQKSGYTLTAYKVYHGTELLATLPATTLQYTLPEDAEGSYGVRAVYGERESEQASATVSTLTSFANTAFDFTGSGFSIPDVFTSKYTQATIEFWIRPHSLADWNQSAGPGWGSFMMHANANGTFTAGWNTTSGDRLNVSGALSTSAFKHVALVVDGNKMVCYVNGMAKGTINSSNYSGLGGFGALVFNGGSDASTNQNAVYDEIRIWKKALTAKEISTNYRRQFADGLLPNDLIAYYKGDLITVDGEEKMRDHSAGQHHASFIGDNHAIETSNVPGAYYDYSTPKVEIEQPTGTVYAGQPVTLTATGSTSIQKVQWTIADAGMENVTATSPVVTFNHAGDQTVKIVATNIKGVEATAETTIHVEEAEAPKADFTVSKAQVAVGERITLIPSVLNDCYSYSWTTEGGSVEKASQPYVTLSYGVSGSYPVTLTVTDAQGHKATTTQTINVAAVAPKAAFDVNPAVVMKGEEVRLTNQSLYGTDQCIWTLVSQQNAMQGEGNSLLFKPTEPGIYNVTLTAKNAAGKGEATQDNALIVCNADSKTGLSFSPSATAQVKLSKFPLSSGQQNFSIDWWMRPGSLSSPCLGIGDNRGTFQIVTYANGQMRLYISGKDAHSVEGFVKPNEWHHYAVTFYMGYVCFYRDGEVISRGSTTQTSLPSYNKFSLGSDDAPMTGIVDEFRVWTTCFSENNLSQLHSYITAPMTASQVSSAVSSKGLQVYYQFDQNSGDVVDATKNSNTGVRSGFGPDGDAWSDSRGVFALNFNSSTTDVSSKYLTNYQAPFENTGNAFSSAVANRFMELSGWTLKNVNSTKYNTGAHVDIQKESYLTLTTGWDGFESSLDNHMVYQTVTLPAGAYVFTANFGNYEGEASGNYLVVAGGDELPETANLNTEALAYKAMDSKSTSSQNKVFFALTEPTTVSLGIVANMAGQQCMSIRSFALTTLPLTQIKGLVDGIDNLDTPQSLNANIEHIYDLSGRRIQLPGKGVYIIGGKKVIR